MTAFFGKIRSWLDDALPTLSYNELRLLNMVVFDARGFDRCVIARADIPARTGMHRNRVAGTVKALEARGFLTAQPDPDDDRNVVLVLPLTLHPESADLHRESAVKPTKQVHRKSASVHSQSAVNAPPECNDAPERCTDAPPECNVSAVACEPVANTRVYAGAHAQEKSEKSEKTESPDGAGGISQPASGQAPPAKPPKLPSMRMSSASVQLGGAPLVASTPKRKPAPDAKANADLTALYTAWHDAVGKPTGGMTMDRAKDLRGILLECGSLDTAILCVKGLGLSTHHMGKNDTGQLFIEPKYCRKDTNRDNFIRAAQGAQKPKFNPHPPPVDQVLRERDEWVAPPPPPEKPPEPPPSAEQVAMARKFTNDFLSRHGVKPIPEVAK